MCYSEDEVFQNREHVLQEIRYCNRAANYVVYLCFFIAIGVISDLLGMKLLLGSTSWLLLAVVAGILSLGPIIHGVLAKHLLGMELIDKEKKHYFTFVDLNYIVENITMFL